MSLTNDMIKLKEIADEIAEKREQKMTAPASMVQKSENSYYEKRTDWSNRVETILHPYEFTTPMELKSELESMWNEMDKKEMCGFILVSMVSAAKNRPKQGGQGVEHKISPYIYEF